ncbi:transglycosylase SLT domain-containing protein [Cellulomonas sp. URHD0024]|uniref:transglycosylase SLT domain-containing protein n=1 Tax=Cellulomonas sp. URHD0024 TaxID=1302620 RepID=UPI00040CCEDE|nr:transglycosylase SLT domain-containing protein [Cellulomonas sp. URHD0024]
MIKIALAAAGLLAVPAVAILTALSVGGAADACIATSSSDPLADDAPIPATANAWISEAKQACPDLPETWIAAVMAQESGFRPDAHAADANGGTWGLLQLNATIWQAAYGHPVSADLNDNGTADIEDPDIHARVAGRYLCNRLGGVRQIRTQHPNWASSSLPELDALVIAHNAGESRLRTYPTIPAVTRTFITNVDQRMVEWSTDDTSGAEPEDPNLAATPTPWAPGSAAGCVPDLGSGDVLVPPGTPTDVATAVRNALAYVGVTSGWRQLCDRLACRAYGYVGSGYLSAKAHWTDMLATGHAHPGDMCPPLGAFTFWNTGRPFGHASLVVQADPGCDPNKIMLTANEVFDRATGNRGGVYLISLARLRSMYLNGSGYLGWTDPICRGALLPAGTTHPAPADGPA